MTVIISDRDDTTTYTRDRVAAYQMARTFEALGWVVERQRESIIITREVW